MKLINSETYFDRIQHERISIAFNMNFLSTNPTMHWGTALHRTEAHPRSTYACYKMAETVGQWDQFFDCILKLLDDAELYNDVDDLSTRENIAFR